MILFDKYGDSLDKHWNSKKKLSNSISFPKLDQFYKEALNIGCLGGKMIGAGGGGFVIIYSSTISIKKKLIKCSGKYNFKHTPFRFINYQ